MKLEFANFQNLIKQGQNKRYPDRSFGVLFTVIFVFLTHLFYDQEKVLLEQPFAILTVTLFIITLFKPILLRPFCMLWMKVGVLIAKIVSPLVIGLLFFSIITPISIFGRLVGRDELNIFKKPSTTNYSNYETSKTSLEKLRKMF